MLLDHTWLTAISVVFQGNILPRKKDSELIQGYGRSLTEEYQGGPEGQEINQAAGTDSNSRCKPEVQRSHGC